MPIINFYEAAFFSNAAYNEVCDLLENWKRIVFFQYENGLGISVFNNDHERKTVVAFRGTHNLANVISDAQLLLQWPLSVAEHANLFYDEHKTHHHPRVIFTGHSLGAALASSMSLDYGIPAIIFDSPGFYPSAQRKPYFSRHEELIHSIMGQPNFINTCHPHVGTLLFANTSIGHGLVGSTLDIIRQQPALPNLLGLRAETLTTAINFTDGALSLRSTAYLHKMQHFLEYLANPANSVVYIKKWCNWVEHTNNLQEIPRLIRNYKTSEIVVNDTLLENSISTQQNTTYFLVPNSSNTIILERTINMFNFSQPITLTTSTRNTTMPINILRIRKFLDDTTEILESNVNTNLVLIFGNSQIGKSVLINYLLGRYFSIRDEEVYSIREGAEPILARYDTTLPAQVGTGDNTQTTIPGINKPRYTAGQNLMLCDLPGFGNMYSSENQAMDSIVIQKVIELSASVQGVIVAIGYAEIMARPSAMFQQCLTNLSQVLTQETLSRLVFTITWPSAAPNALQRLQTRLREIRTALNDNIDHAYTDLIEAITENFSGIALVTQILTSPREMLQSALNFFLEIAPIAIKNLMNTVIQGSGYEEKERNYKIQIAIIDEMLKPDRLIFAYINDDFEHTHNGNTRAMIFRQLQVINKDFIDFSRHEKGRKDFISTVKEYTSEACSLLDCLAFNEIKISGKKGRLNYLVDSISSAVSKIESLQTESMAIYEEQLRDEIEIENRELTRIDADIELLRLTINALEAEIARLNSDTPFQYDKLKKSDSARYTWSEIKFHWEQPVVINSFQLVYNRDSSTLFNHEEYCGAPESSYSARLQSNQWRTPINGNLYVYMQEKHRPGNQEKITELRKQIHEHRRALITLGQEKESSALKIARLNRKLGNMTADFSSDEARQAEIRSLTTNVQTTKEEKQTCEVELESLNSELEGVRSKIESKKEHYNTCYILLTKYKLIVEGPDITKFLTKYHPNLERPEMLRGAAARANTAFFHHNRFTPNERFQRFITTWTQETDDEILRTQLEETRTEFIRHHQREFNACASRYTLKLYDVPGDGSCFFHALLDQLQLRHPEILETLKTRFPGGVDHNALREFAVESLLLAAEQGDLPASADEIDAYILNMARENAWADGVVIPVLANALGITIVLINSQFERDQDRLTRVHGGEAGTVYIAYQVGIHFQSTRGNADIRRMDRDMRLRDQPNDTAPSLAAGPALYGRAAQQIAADAAQQIGVRRRLDAEEREEVPARRSARYM